MADPITSAITQTIVENLTSAAIKEIGRIWGFNDHLQALQNTFTALQAELADAEMLRKKTEAQKNWLRRLKDVAYDVEDLLDLIQYKDLKRRAESSSEKGKFLPSFGLRFRIKMANRLKNVRKKLDAIASDKNIFPPREGVVENRFGVMNESGHTGSLVLESEIYGRDDAKEIILVNLLHHYMINQNHLSVLAICGMGGLGKTTLAQLVYNDERVEKHFDLRMWVCVSDDFHVERLVTRIIQCAGPSCDKSEFDQLQRHLQHSLMGKKFLLVLDDVWNEDPMSWDQLRQTLTCDSKGSVVLVTTRNKEVAMKMAAIYTHDIGCLSEDHSWSLFTHSAFSTGNDNENLVPIGKRIVKKCQGVPLSIKAIGSMMLGITSESDWVAVENNGIWDQLENKNVATPALRLSYYNLELRLRLCFAYCCIFPKDYVMKENHLIQLWIANGFIPTGDQKDVFSIGQSIFRKLAWRSFFQEIENDRKGNVTCKMHDLMHDLASSIMEDETYVVEREMENNFPKMVRHLYFHDIAFDDFMEKYDKYMQLPRDSIRSLIIDDERWKDVKEKDIVSLLSKQHFLRVLQLPIPVNLSKLFGKFKHLKHLVMACENMKRLANSITSLYNLQTLKLMDSRCLLKLPKYLRVLKKLCCLEMDSYHSLRCSPPGLGELACLCRLPIFIVGESTSQQIGQLEKLNLGGNLCIKGLDNVSNIEDARSAKLINKMNLTSLTLVWSKKGKRKHGERVEEVLEGLQPPHNLEEIEIKCYPGSEFSNWMGSTTFTNLKKVRLYGCENCVCLPALGKLPSLTQLKLEKINSIRSLGVEFLGDAECSFPALTTLKIDRMSNLEDWSIPDSVMSFLCLTNLSLTSCPKLERLPSFGKLPALTDLYLDGFNSIRSLGVEFLGDAECSFPALTTLHINGMSNLEDWSIPDSVRSFPCLTKLSLTSCPKLERLPSFGKLPSLTQLKLKEINSITSLGVEFLGDAECSFPTLTTLEIDGMSNLEDWSIPNSVRSFPCLTELLIKFCPKLERLPSFGKFPSLTDLTLDNILSSKSVCVEWLGELEFSFHALTSLEIRGMLNLEEWGLPELKRLPSLRSLEKLSIRGSNEDFECEEIHKAPIIISFNCLKSLEIRHCDNLRSFPAAILDDMPSLEELTFFCCNKLNPLLGGTLKRVSSLRFLMFFRLPEMQGLPECMQQLTYLTYLEIGYCDECFLPDWFGSLNSLLFLRMVRCKNMKMFPDSFSGLKSLTYLYMHDVAEEVKERCKKAEGQDWPKISHIPYIHINGETIQDCRQVGRQVR